MKTSTARILVMIPTRNRAADISAYLFDAMPFIDAGDVEILVVDSSDGEETRIAVDDYTQTHDHGVNYEKSDDPGIADEKTILALVKHRLDADYIWVCGDRRVINFKDALPLLEECIAEGADIIHFDHLDPYKLGRRIYRNNCQDFLRDCAWNVTLYGSTVISSRVAEVFENIDLVAKYLGSGFAYQMMLFEYCAAESFIAIHQPCMFYKEKNPLAVKSEWSDKYIWQWATSWTACIDQLPSAYDGVKDATVMSHDDVTGMFSIKKLLQFRARGGVTSREISEAEFALRRTTKTPLWLFHAVSKIHPVLLSWIPEIVNAKHQFCSLKRVHWCHSLENDSFDK